MPRNSPGTYTLPSSVNSVVSGTPITTSWANTTLDDVQQALTDSLDRQGRGGMLAPFKFFDGSVAAPGASFTNETSSGFSRVGAGVIGVSSLATKVAEFGPAGLRTADGAQATPSLTFVSDTDTGFFKAAADTIAATTAAVERFRVSAAGISITGALAQFLGLNADAAANPSFSWVGDADTGMMHGGADSIAFAVGGLQTWNITAGGSFASSATPPTWGATQGKLSIAGTTSGFGSSIVNSRFSNDTAGPSIRLAKSRSGVIGQYGTGLSSSDTIGEILWYGSNTVDGSSLGARIRAIASEAWTAANNGANLQFAIQLNGGGSFSTMMTLSDAGATIAGDVVAAGSVRMGGSALAAPIAAIKDGTATGAVANSNADSLVIDGTGNTGLSFLGTSGTSIQQILFGDTVSNAAGGISYNHGTDAMGFSAGGSVFVIDAGGITMTSGREVILADVTPTSTFSAGYRGIPTVGGIGTPTKAHVGKCLVNTGTTTFNTPVFAAGDAVSVYNNSAAAISLAQGAGVTMRLAGTTTTGSRTLAARGFATVFWISGTECIVSGSGVS